MTRIGAGTILMVISGPAAAETAVVSDYARDALLISSTGVSLGDFDIDLRSVHIDHGSATLQITSTFSFTNETSWSNLNLSIDTNGDSVEDYRVLGTKTRDGSRVLDSVGSVRCSSIGMQETFGINGTVIMSIPRACLGTPTTVAVHVDVYWFGSRAYGDNLTYIDSAPGMFVDAPRTYSSPVSSSNTGTATSPLSPTLAGTDAPVVRTKTGVRVVLSKKAQSFNGVPARLKIRVTGAGTATGRVTISSGKKVLKTVPVTVGRRFTYRLPKSLKPGRHRLRVVFVPTDAAVVLSSSKAVRLRVRKPGL